MQPLSYFVSSLALCPALAASALAQCPEWDLSQASTGIEGPVDALVWFDDGSGSKLHAGGAFEHVSGAAASNVARWNGSAWEPVAAGLGVRVRALAVYDDGTGPALHAGGGKGLIGGGSLAGTNLARWTPGGWVQVSTEITTQIVFAMEVFDDGAGPALFLGGDEGVRRWDGASMSLILSDDVSDLEVFDDGSGPALYATATPGTFPNHVVKKWTGTGGWVVASPSTGGVNELCAHDDGSGPALYVNAYISAVSGTDVYRLEQGSFVPFGDLEGSVDVFFSYDDGTGPVLLAGGQFWGAHSGYHVASWDGNAWTTPATLDGRARTYTSGPTGELYAGGQFDVIEGAFVGSAARLDPIGWAALGTGNGFDQTVTELVTYDDGSGEALHVGGRFEWTGSVAANGVARRNGTGWEALGSGLDGTVSALATYDDGSGAALYAGGSFVTAGGLAASGVARWNGASWSAVGAGFAARVNDFTAWDDGTGTALYAGGEFPGRVAAWNGSQWTLVPGAPDGFVNALQTWDDGSGPALYVAGPFFTAGGLQAQGVARWNGVAWSAVGAGLTPGAQVNQLIVHDDGAGERLYACGAFTSSGAVAVHRIARWDGSSWSPVGALGFDDQVLGLAVHDDEDGSGPALYATGRFKTVDGVAAQRLARWDGASWSAVGQGLADDGHVALSLRDPSGAPALWIGGEFVEAGGVQSARIARVANTCPEVGVNYCTAGTSASGCRALISATGLPSASAPSGFFLHADSGEGNKLGLFVWSSNGKQANPWGNGTSYICVTPPRYRSAQQGPSGALGLCDASYTADLNARWTAKPNQNPGEGAVAQAQFWYRDPLNTSNQSSGFSDAIEFTVGP